MSTVEDRLLVLAALGHCACGLRENADRQSIAGPVVREERELFDENVCIVRISCQLRCDVCGDCHEFSTITPRPSNADASTADLLVP